MKAAQILAYNKPLVFKDIPIPVIQADEVLVKVEACGMCRSDVLLVDGFFRNYANIPPPVIPGHEITGTIEKIGSVVPKAAGLEEGEHVVVSPGWGDGICRHCQVGNTHICPNVRWPGFGTYGGFAEYIPVPARYVIKVAKHLKFEELAPLTDAGLTPYRGIKKIRDAGGLGPDRVIGVFGVGGLGAYAVQYAKLLGAGATVVAFARNPDKLAVAKKYGADNIIKVKGKTAGDVGKELKKATGQDKLDAIIGHYADVGFVGDRIDVPLFPRVSGEQTFHGSFWGNNADLSEVMALAAEGKIKHTIKTIGFDQINRFLDLMRGNDIVGRAVLKF